MPSPLPARSPQPLSDYREFAPPAPLAAHFLCFWTQTIAGPPGAFDHRVLPDACLDIVLIDDQPPTLVGPWTVPFIARLPVGAIVTGARFRPGCAPALLGSPASELLNRSVPLADFQGPVRRAPIAKVIEQSAPAARRSALAQVLLAAVQSAAPSDRAVLAALDWLSGHPRGRIAQLSRAIGIGPRQLLRRFSAAIGYSPKMFQSILRFQLLLKSARAQRAQRRLANLADLAANAGYADQSHMTREVQRFSSLPPTALLPSAHSTLLMSDSFKT